MIKQLAKNKENNNGEPLSDAMQGASILIVSFIELFLIIFYIVLGNKIGTTEFIVMSALQVFTCLWSFGVNLSEIKQRLVTILKILSSTDSSCYLMWC